jgi:hypothetical protein
MKEEQEDQIISSLHTILKPFLLRRLKTDGKWMNRKDSVVIYSLASYSGALFAQEKGILAVRASDNGPKDPLRRHPEA